MSQYQRDSMAAAGSLVHKMHPDTIDSGPEVIEPVQPAFLRTPVEAVRPVLQQTPQVAEDLVAQRDTELLRLEDSHVLSLPSVDTQPPSRSCTIENRRKARRAAS